jgi:excinuclease ABC subunit A
VSGLHDRIVIRGARLHNLRNISVEIPRNRLIVFTGLSGSGKSTLALNTLHREGARQYMESLGLVTDGMRRPPVDEITGLSPSISVDQHLTNRSPRSTVGTATEVFTYLRVLFARLGHRPCPQCGEDIPPAVQAADDAWAEDEAEPDAGETVSCPGCGTQVPALSMTSFSFNKPAGACPACTGLGVVADLVTERLFDPVRGVRDGGVVIWDAFNADRFATTLERAGHHYGFAFDPLTPIGELGEAARDLLYYGVESQQFRRHVPGIAPPPSVTKGYFEGVITNLRRRYGEGLSNSGLSVRMQDLFASRTCPDCSGTRLRAESRQVRVAGQTITDLSRLPLTEVAVWLERAYGELSEPARLIAEPVRADLRERLRRLVSIGVGYLSIDRATPSLSAGEAQRLRLAALLGSGLTGVLYILDEPTIGLHQRDTDRLIRFLRQLRDLGNTVVVIEHDLEVIRAADHVIELGPGAGSDGGQVVTAGTPHEVARHPTSLTGAFLSGRARLPARPRAQPSGELVIEGAREHNLKGITVRIPLGSLVAVTGVSGSGKSTLVFDILAAAARRHFGGASEAAGAHDAIAGWHEIDRVVSVDQSPIGRIPRSNVATYTDLFTGVRTLFAAQEEAARRGLGPGHFSFNVSGGRCERCEGAGSLTVNMHFLPDVQVRCPSCLGRRFRKEVLGVTYRGADIASVLEMTVAEALPLFGEVPDIAGKLALLAEVGLGYLKLGQPATTLSGGEAQRVKLAKELGRGKARRTLYLLDEPTTGLHPADVVRLLTLLRKLVDAGNTVLVVEHHLELVGSADWLIDLGPEGGLAGGRLVAEGTPEQVAEVADSQTGCCLRRLLAGTP